MQQYSEQLAIAVEESQAKLKKDIEHAFMERDHTSFQNALQIALKKQLEYIADARLTNEQITANKKIKQHQQYSHTSVFTTMSNPFTLLSNELLEKVLSCGFLKAERSNLALVCRDWHYIIKGIRARYNEVVFPWISSIEAGIIQHLQGFTNPKALILEQHKLVDLHAVSDKLKNVTTLVIGTEVPIVLTLKLFCHLNLESFTCRNHEYILEMLWNDLSMMSNLKHLEFIIPMKWGESMKESNAMGKVISRLESLKIIGHESFKGGLSLRNVTYLCSCCKSLKKLSASGLGTWIAFLMNLKCPTLEEFSYQDKDFVELTHFFTKNPQLRQMVEPLDNNYIPHWTSLEYLECIIYDVPPLDVEMLVALGNHCPKLKKVEISFQPEEDPDEFDKSQINLQDMILRHMFENCPSLHTIIIEYSTPHTMVGKRWKRSNFVGATL